MHYMQIISDAAITLELFVRKLVRKRPSDHFTYDPLLRCGWGVIIIRSEQVPTWIFGHGREEETRYCHLATDLNLNGKILEFSRNRTFCHLLSDLTPALGRL